ncbi:MAG: tetratricopeptide repeat protein [Flavobacteriales bacterium]|nr:tetratricopeptide repeat protein [Flavobacteriales bacterium]
MNKQQKFRIAAAVFAILLFVLLLMVPRTPQSDDGDSALATQSYAVDDEVQEALEMVQGEQPMQGILKLRSILEKDPENIDAAWNLGRFSIETGQFENAIKRFEQLLIYDENDKYLDTYIYLGHAYEQTGDVVKAKMNYERFLESESEPQLMEEVRKRIAGLE